MLGPYQWYHEPNPRHFTISCWYCWLFKHCWILQSVGVSSVSSCVSKYQPLAARFFWPLCSEEARTEEDRKGNVEVVKAATTKKCWHAGIYDICTVYIYIYYYTYIYIFVSLNLICKTSYNLVVHTFHFLSFELFKDWCQTWYFDTLILDDGFHLLHLSGRLPMCTPPKLAVLLAMFSDAGDRQGWVQLLDARPEMLIQVFVHFDKENPDGTWTLVDYERREIVRILGKLPHCGFLILFVIRVYTCSSGI